MLILKKITYKNFLSTGNKSITVDLLKNKNTLIVGDNGSGKSTISEAIFYSLFGKPLRNCNSPNLINNICCRKMLVIIEFSVYDKEFRIVRGQKPNIFEIYKDGVLIDQGVGTKEYQNILQNDILKISPKSFKQSVVLGSTNYKPFLELSLKDRRDIIEAALHIEEFSSIIAMGKIHISEIKAKKKELSHQRNLLINSREHITKAIELAKADNKNKIATLQIDIVKLKKKIKSLVTKPTKKYEGLCPAISAGNTKIQKFKFSLAEIDKKLILYKNKKCPTCDQDLINVESYISKLRMDKQELNNQLKAALINFGVLTRHKENLEKITDFNTKVMNDRSTFTEFLNNLEIELQQFSEKKPLNLILKNEELDTINLTLKEVCIKNKKYDLDLKEYDFIINSSGLLDKAKQSIISRSINIINTLIIKNLAILGFGIKFKFSESFDYEIVYKGRNLNYYNLSSGESFKVDLSIMFAFRDFAKLKTRNCCNLLILDEVGDSVLDNSGTESINDILKTLVDTNVFIVSHRDRDYENILKFQKVGHFSEMITNNA